VKRIRGDETNPARLGLAAQGVRSLIVSLGLLLSNDLIFTSRITGTAHKLGLTVQAARSSDLLLTLAWQQTPTCVLIDLANPGLSVPTLIRQLEEACTPRPGIMAYGSHVDAAGLRAAP
jgi:CheY-like chemotaxis protein